MRAPDACSPSRTRPPTPCSPTPSPRSRRQRENPGPLPEVATGTLDELLGLDFLPAAGPLPAAACCVRPPPGRRASPSCPATCASSSRRCRPAPWRKSSPAARRRHRRSDSRTRRASPPAAGDPRSRLPPRPLRPAAARHPPRGRAVPACRPGDARLPGLEGTVVRALPRPERRAAGSPARTCADRQGATRARAIPHQAGHRPREGAVACAAGQTSHPSQASPRWPRRRCPNLTPATSPSRTPPRTTTSRSPTSSPTATVCCANARPCAPGVRHLEAALDEGFRLLGEVGDFLGLQAPAARRADRVVQFRCTGGVPGDGLGSQLVGWTAKANFVPKPPPENPS